jgi:hypothetical protein
VAGSVAVVAAPRWSAPAAAPRHRDRYNQLVRRAGPRIDGE